MTAAQAGRQSEAPAGTRAERRYRTADETELGFAEPLVPSSPTAAMHASAISTTASAYSTELPPRWA